MEDLDEHRKFKGVVKILDRQYNDASELQKQKLEQYLTNQPCEACGGKRLKAEAQSVKQKVRIRVENARGEKIC